MNAKETVVSVWRGGVNRGAFIGSAFFISPSLLLTARHVVRDENSKTLFEDLSLGLVQGQNQVDLESNNIYCHQHLDIALIYLACPNERQASCSLNLSHQGYSDQTVDCFGINKDNKDRDSNRGYTVGISDRPHSGYCFDHRVKRGFSGGPVSLRQSDAVIGVISQRDKDDQETLFIHLSQQECKDWLMEINDRFHDSVLADRLSAPLLHDEKGARQTQFFSSLDKLTLFIDRPADAYQHVIDELNESDTAVKICLCLITSDEDKPRDFAQALAFKLAAKNSENPKRKLLECVENDDFDPSVVNMAAWNAEKYPQFFRRCMTDILESIAGGSFEANKKETASEPERKILELLRNRRTPKVLMLSCEMPRGFRFFSQRRLTNQLKQRFQWIIKFNETWQELTASAATQPVAFLFFVQVDQNIVEKAPKCFSLKKIDKNAFYDWTAFVGGVLKSKGAIRNNEIFGLLGEYEERFSTRLEKHDLEFPLTYRQFINQTKKLTE